MQHLCALAEEKDSGFNPRVLADAMNAAAAHPDHAFTELGLSNEATSQLRSKAQARRAGLLATNAEYPSRASLAPPPPTRPRRPEQDLPPNDHGREGPSLSF